MTHNVSRERARKARQRQKQAGREQAAARKPSQRPIVALAVAIFTWILLFTVFRIPITQGYPAIDLVNWPPLVADALIGAVAFFGVYLFLLGTEPRLLSRNSRVVLLCLVCITSTFTGALLLYSRGFLGEETAILYPFTLPFALAPLLATLLLGTKAGIAAGTLAAIALSVYAGRSMPLLINGLLCTLLICHLTPAIRTRSRIIRISFLAGIIQIPAVIILAILSPAPPAIATMASQAITCILSGFLSGILALILLPLFEHIFHIASNITLLEFCDLGHPLLQRLAIEAPGTYHHSLIVANIAQAAADAIGTNSLEARVSAYFHDIGKLTKPAFFAENIHHGAGNPHDQLTPSMSTLIITAHVKEGISLAMLHKLPTCVHRAILEHHGTSVLQCFHHKAITRQLELKIEESPPPRLDDSQFRYPGPRPSTRVSGIICLADSVEAASRCLEKPTPGHLETLVAEIVRKKIDDGQLDNCELSLIELSRIRKAFVFTLANMLHGRIAYPVNENQDNKPNQTDPGERRGPEAPDPEDPAPGTTA